LLASSNTFQYDERFAAPEILVYQFSRLKIQAFIFRKKYRGENLKKVFGNIICRNSVTAFMQVVPAARLPASGFHSVAFAATF
jgi:acyl-CoA thioesterase